MMLIGNPLPGAATAPEMLPGWSGVVWLTIGVVLCLAGGKWVRAAGAS